MTAYWFITNLLAAFLLPPLSLILLMAWGLRLRKRRPGLARTLLGGGLAGLWLLSTPLIATSLLGSLMPPPRALNATQADAIVVLGGGRYKDALEYGGRDTLNHFSLERVRYGAHLARTLHKPVLVTGGAPEGADISEGALMRQAMQEEFRVAVRWAETASRNTLENATLSAPLLRAEGIKRIYLVSHAWHLARAVPEFERQGFTVIPAGIGQKARNELEFFDFVPNAKALLNSYLATHEWIGLFWYRIRHL